MLQSPWNYICKPKWALCWGTAARGWPLEPRGIAMFLTAVSRNPSRAWGSSSPVSRGREKRIWRSWYSVWTVSQMIKWTVLKGGVKRWFYWFACLPPQNWTLFFFLLVQKLDFRIDGTDWGRDYHWCSESSWFPDWGWLRSHCSKRRLSIRMYW